MPVPAPLAPPRRGVGDARRHDRFAAIRALQQSGWPVRASGRALGLSRPTVRQYRRAEACPMRTRHRRVRGPGSPRVASLRARWAAGCDNAALLRHELRARGSPGSAGAVRRVLGAWRAAPRRRGRRARAGRGRTPPPPPSLPSPRQVRWWLLRAPDEHPAEWQAYLARLRQDRPARQQARDPARAFGRLLRQRAAPARDTGLVRAETRGSAAFRRCATSLRQDHAAVAAASHEPYSTGPPAGNVTRPKLLERQMYGRAQPDRLRQRVRYRARYVARG